MSKQEAPAYSNTPQPPQAVYQNNNAPPYPGVPGPSDANNYGYQQGPPMGYYNQGQPQYGQPQYGPGPGYGQPPPAGYYAPNGYQQQPYPVQRRSDSDDCLTALLGTAACCCCLDCLLF